MNTTTMMKDVFVVTKPLQYINVLNIENNNKKILILVDSFINSEVIYNKIKSTSSYWSEVYLFKNMNETFNWLIKYKNYLNTLYIDSDLGWRKEFSILKNLNITVYEEGIGSYRKKQYKPRRRILGALYLLYLELLGYKNRRGGNKHTKNIIVYYPIFYKTYLNENKKNILSFKKDFIEHIQSCRELDIFNLNINLTCLTNKTVILYFSSWEIDMEDITLIRNIPHDISIIKLHPHRKTSHISPDFDITIVDAIPAELLILKIIKFAKHLTIVSKYSTSVIYFLSDPKITIINTFVPQIKYLDSSCYLDTYEKLTKYIYKGFKL